MVECERGIRPTEIKGGGESMKFLLDPSWWLRAVCAGVIIGIIAGLIKDYISKILSRFSARFKSWRQKRNAAFNHRAKSIAKEFGLIIYAKLQSISLLLLWSLMSIVALVIVVKSEIIGKYSLSSYIGAAIFGALSLIPYYRSLYFLRLSAEARKIYEKNKFSGARKKATRKKRATRRKKLTATKRVK
ncbi:MAG: hypothetical protein MUO24_00795 [Desulfobacterales bacterium]|nr:hypothetical protein [Desulfobacterales bacterium]